MSAPLQGALVFGLIAALLGAMVGLRSLAKAWNLSPEVQRKTVHMGAGGLATLLPWLFTDDWPVWLMLALTLGAMVALRSNLLARFGSTLHGVERHSYGDYLLVAAVGLCFLLHDGVPVLYVLPLLVLTVADAAAALAGSTYGRTFMVREDGRKSVEGSAVCFLVTLLLSMVCLLLLSDTPRENVVLISLVLAVFATILEADSWHGFDNIFLPMGVLFVLWLTLDVSAWVAARDLGLILVAMGVMAWVAWAMGFGGHVARVHALSVFMVMAVAGAANTILPVLAIWAYAWTHRPSTSPQAPQSTRAPLAMIAALALISFGFLAFGTVMHGNSLNAYALAAAGMAAGYLGQLRMSVCFTGAMLLAATWIWVIPLNPGGLFTAPLVQALGAGAIIATAMITTMRWSLFAPNPMVRVSALATLPAFSLYALQLLEVV